MANLSCGRKDCGRKDCGSKCNEISLLILIFLFPAAILSSKS